MSGQIRVGEHQGVYVIRFSGDVRLTLSAPFDHYVASMFDDPQFASIVIDLSEAKAVDSTSLGVLANLSLTMQSLRGKLPLLVCESPDLLRILTNMGFDDIFAIVDEQFDFANGLAELPMAHDLDERTLRERVIQAHQTLMQLNESNREVFKSLVEALEQEGVAAPATPPFRRRHGG